MHTINNAQTALLLTFDATGSTYNELLKSFASQGEPTPQLLSLLDMAAEADRTAQDAAEAARWLAERLGRDAQAFEDGHRDDNALGYSAVRDLQEARIRHEERSGGYGWVTIVEQVGNASIRVALELIDGDVAEVAAAQATIRKAARHV